MTSDDERCAWMRGLARGTRAHADISFRAFFQLRGRTVPIGTVRLYRVLDDLLGKETLQVANAVFTALTTFDVSVAAPPPPRTLHPNPSRSSRAISTWGQPRC